MEDQLENQNFDPGHEQLAATVNRLGFPELIPVKGRASIADLFSKRKRCGIYVLGFDDGRAYAGKSTDVTRRYVQHCQRFENIDAITFKCVRDVDHDAVEPDVIAQLEAAGHKLQNVVYSSIPRADSDLATIITAEEQDRWRVDGICVAKSARRVQDDALRLRYRRKYRRLEQHPFFAPAVELLRIFVQNGVIAPRMTELSFWSATCLTNRPNGLAPALARINIYQQEVFTLWEENGVLWMQMQTARKMLEREFGATLRGVERLFSGSEVVDFYYPTGGADQVRIVAPAIGMAFQVLGDPTILAAVRDFNLRLMSKGPNLNASSHCLDLADHLVDSRSELSHDPREDHESRIAVGAAGQA